MTRAYRTYLGLILAALLAFTSQSMAVARGMPDAAGQIILCTGQGIVTVSVDEHGQPVERPHICPDCAMSLFAALAEAPRLPVRPLGRVEKLVPLRVALAASWREIEPAARGPPGRA